RQRSVERRHWERIEIVRRGSRSRDGDRPRTRGRVGDVTRRLRRALGGRGADVVTIGVPGLAAGDDADADALGDVLAGALHEAISDRERLAGADLEVQVTVVGAAGEGGAKRAIEGAGRQPVTVVEEAIGSSGNRHHTSPWRCGISYGTRCLRGGKADVGSR